MGRAPHHHQPPIVPTNPRARCFASQRATTCLPAMATPMTTPASSTSLSASGSPAPANQANAAYGLDTLRKRDQFKVLVRFKGVGSAPVMKNNVFRISAFNKFLAVHVFLRRELGCKPADNLYLYINAAFSPALDDTVGNLFRVRAVLLNLCAWCWRR